MKKKARGRRSADPGPRRSGALRPLPPCAEFSLAVLRVPHTPTRTRARPPARAPISPALRKTTLTHRQRLRHHGTVVDPGLVSPRSSAVAGRPVIAAVARPPLPAGFSTPCPPAIPPRFPQSFALSIPCPRTRRVTRVLAGYKHTSPAKPSRAVTPRKHGFLWPASDGTMGAKSPSRLLLRVARQRRRRGATLSVPSSGQCPVRRAVIPPGSLA